MFVFPHLLRCPRAGVFAVVLCAAAWTSTVRGQQQEGGTLDRILNPNRDMTYSPADKQFTASSAVNNRQAPVRAYAFGGDATYHGDGAFRTKAFNGKDAYRTRSYDTHAAQTAGKSFAQTGKSFDTKAAAVQEDRAAHKTMASNEYAAGEKPYLGKGKRQDTIDELHQDKNLTIDQVRELLNKSK